MKNIFGISIWMLFAAASLTLFTQCKKDDDVVVPDDLLEVNNTTGYSHMNLQVCQTNLDNLPTETLSQAEEDGILWMREEEKLARDVYLTLYNEWNAQVFNNISTAEETHFDVMLLLIEKYNLTDPAAGNAVGVFTNTSLQDLYDDLTLTGANSLIDALTVGAAIEEIDILDLENQLDHMIDNQDLELIYMNLMAASKNHLRAFVKNLTNQGITYVPEYLSQEAYDDIINNSWESGHHGG